MKLAPSISMGLSLDFRRPFQFSAVTTVERQEHHAPDRLETIGDYLQET